MTELTQFEIGPASKLNTSDLTKTLTQVQVSFLERAEERHRVVVIGSEAEYELRIKLGLWGRPKKAFILTRYEHPTLKGIFQDWADSCGVEIAEEFYVTYFKLSPKILDSVRTTWRVELTDLQAAPVRLGLATMVFTFRRNVAAEIEGQLMNIPHRRMAKSEFIRSAEFSIAGDEPFDIEVYGWRDESDTQRFVVTASAPAMTLLGLWTIPASGTVEHNIGELPSPPSANAA